jgi:hypothetical protein
VARYALYIAAFNSILNGRDYLYCVSSDDCIGVMLVLNEDLKADLFRGVSRGFHQCLSSKRERIWLSTILFLFKSYKKSSKMGQESSVFLFTDYAL